MNELSTNALPSLDLKNPNAILEYGKDCTKQINAFTDQFLSEIKSSDAGEFGERLSSILSLTKTLDFGTLVTSKPSLMRRVSTFFKRKTEEIRSNFEAVSTQVDRLIAELETTRTTLIKRISTLDKLYDLNVQEYKNLQAYIDNGARFVEDLKTQADKITSVDLMDRQQATDLRSAADRLDKRLADLRIAQAIALQTAPEIRLIQNNSQLLVSKFDDISTLTVPSWKKQLLLALAINEQAQSAKLQESIDDATNAILRSNADMLHNNSVTIAKGNQRMLVDVETLSYAHSKLLQSVQDIAKVTQEGETQRRALEANLETMRASIQAALCPRTQEALQVTVEDTHVALPGSE